MNVIGSPNISVLDFTALFDLSSATPKIVVTNASVGSNLAACTWWFVVASPLGVAMHTGSLTVPDRSGAWTTWTMLETWPLKDNHIDWSGSPYTINLYVFDGAGSTFNLPYGTEIIPPSGNDAQVGNNFGVASFTQQVKCNTGNVYVQDLTNYIYKSTMGSITTQKWTMKYPPSGTGTSNADMIVTGNPYALFNIDYNANGYAVLMEVVRDFPVTANATVRLKYNGQHTFNVQCSLELCNLACGLQKLVYKISGCMPCRSDDRLSRITNISAKINMALIGVNAGCTDIDLSALINEIKKLLGEFDCCCGDSGTGVDSDVFNASPLTVLNVWNRQTNITPIQCPGSFYPATLYAPDGTTPIGTATSVLSMISMMNSNAAWAALGTAVFNGDQCDVNFYPVDNTTPLPHILVDIIDTTVVVNIIDKATGIAPAACPASFYPATVYAPNGTTAIGTASSIYSLISIVNSNAAWLALGTAVYNTHQCDVNFIPVGAAPPVIKISLVSPSTFITLSNGCTGAAPVGCSTNAFYPCSLWTPDGSTLIVGIISNRAALITAINANAAWSALGVAFDNGNNCQIGWTPSVSTPAHVTITSGPCCHNNQYSITVKSSDMCVGTGITPASFPLNATVDFGIGGGVVSLGTIASMAAFIIALNTTSTKPTGLSFADASLIGGSFGDIFVSSNSCSDYNGTPSVKVDANSSGFLLYGANHGNMAQSIFLNGPGGEFGIGLGISAFLGKISGSLSDFPSWHTIMVGKYLLVTYPNVSVSQVKIFDMSSPLNPVFVRAITLPDLGTGLSFLGTPSTITAASGGAPIPSNYGLYFPTDYGNTDIHNIYVVEPMTGSIWKIDITGSGSGVVATYGISPVRGKCPRVVYNGKIYFSQDGDLQLQSGIVSPSVVPGQALVVDFPGGIIRPTTLNVFTAQEEVWAISYDGANSLYYVGRQGSVRIYDLVSGTFPSAQISGVFPVANFRLNAKIGSRGLYLCSTHFSTGSTGTYLWDFTHLPTVVVVPFNNFTPPGDVVPNNDSHYNALPLGNCLVLVTFNDTNDPARHGGVAIFMEDGTYVSVVQIGSSQNLYNVVAIPGISVYLPNTLV